MLVLNIQLVELSSKMIHLFVSTLNLIKVAYYSFIRVQEVYTINVQNLEAK